MSSLGGVGGQVIESLYLLGGIPLVFLTGLPDIFHFLYLTQIIFTKSLISLINKLLKEDEGRKNIPGTLVY